MSSPPKEKVETKGGHPPAVGTLRALLLDDADVEGTVVVVQLEEDRLRCTWTGAVKQASGPQLLIAQKDNEWPSHPGCEDREAHEGVSAFNETAVKAGGMRIVQKHQPTAAPEPPQKDEDEEEYVTSSPPKAPLIVSGVVTKGDKDFTPAAAQVAHQKPQPGVPKHPPVQHVNQHIHQPRK